MENQINFAQFEEEQVVKWLNALQLSTEGSKEEQVMRLSNHFMQAPRYFLGLDEKLNEKLCENDEMTAEVSQIQNDVVMYERHAEKNYVPVIKTPLCGEIQMNQETPQQVNTQATNAVGVKQQQESNNIIMQESASVSLTLAKEALVDFDGKTGARGWVMQLKNIANVYNINDNCLRMLLICKLKGDAQRWLHANSTRIMEPINKLLDQLIMAFGEKLPKIEMRRKFTGRKWKTYETFSAYFDEKIQLSGDLGIEVDELIDEIIEGIPQEALQIQARMQCFTEPMQMLRAFANIRVSAESTPSSTKTPQKKYVDENLRCRNCNSRGHFAKECRKPKREPGSCYACGKFGHLIAQCSEKKFAKEENYRA